MSCTTVASNRHQRRLPLCILAVPLLCRVLSLVQTRPPSKYVYNYRLMTPNGNITPSHMTCFNHVVTTHILKLLLELRIIDIHT